MKKTILTILAIFFAVYLIDCGPAYNDPTTTEPPADIPIVTDPTPPPADVENPTGNPVKLTIMSTQGTRFYDGTNSWLWKNTQSKKAQSRVYANNNYLYALDDIGTTTDYISLITEPDYVGIILAAPAPLMGKAMIKAGASTEIILADAQVWIVEIIPWEIAMELGMPGVPHTDYTKIYHNGVEHGNWMLRPYPVGNFLILNNEIFAQKTNGTWIAITGTKINIKQVNEDFVIHNFSVATHTATINDINVSWTYNFFSAGGNGATWLKGSTKWYSLNGYTWDGATLVENGSTMWDWRLFSNVVTPAGTHFENGENVLYWVQCATGYVIRYVPSANQYVEFVRLYIGNGSTDFGVQMKASLKPVIIEDDLFFIYQTYTYKYNFQTGLVSLFGSDITEVMGY
jgi:hypothetical protein